MMEAQRKRWLGATGFVVILASLFIRALVHSGALLAAIVLVGGVAAGVGLLLFQRHERNVRRDVLGESE